MVEFRNVGARLGGRTVLSGVSLRVVRGEINVLLGRNGSGKTTLLGCLNGTVPYDGEILLNGRNIAELSCRGRGRQIAFMPQLLPSPAITVAELVEMGRTPYTSLGRGLSDEDRAGIALARERAGLSEIWERPLGRLSGGELQRAYLGMALAQSTELIVLDEPTSHLDMIAGEEFMSLCARLVREEGKTLLITLHDLGTALEHGERIAVMKDGSPAFEGTRQECLDGRVLEKLFSLRRYTDSGRVFFGVSKERAE